MSDHFDAYLEWLAIPPLEQPPHYYRLLGLHSYESDRGLIEKHARKQLQRVTAHRGGNRGDIAEGIANEIMAAQTCLLTPPLKDEYDAKLRDAGVPGEASAPAMPIAPPVRPHSDKNQSAASVSPAQLVVDERSQRTVAVSTRRVQIRKGGSRKRKRGWPGLVAQLLVPFISLGLVWAILAIIRPDLDPLALLFPSERQQEQSQPSARPQSVRTRTTPSRPRTSHDARQVTVEAEVESSPPSQEVVKPEPEESVPVLPAAVDLPPLGYQDWFPLVEKGLPTSERGRLLLISDSVPGQPDWWLRIDEAESDLGTHLWTVQLENRSQVPAQNDKRDRPIAEFLLENGELRFRWAATADKTTHLALVNSLLNVRLGNHEQMMQLRRPLEIAPLTLDLSKQTLRAVLEIPDLPPIERLRFQLTEARFQNLNHKLDGEDRDAAVGRDLPVRVTTPPGVLFHIGLGSVGDKVVFRAQGLYWLGNAGPFEFEQQQVERQAKKLFRAGQAEEAAIPRLQERIYTLERRIDSLQKHVDRTPVAPSTARYRGIMGAQLRAMRATVSAGKAAIAQAKGKGPETTRAFGALQEVASLGNLIHNQATFCYRVTLPIEFEGVQCMVVLLETDAEAAAPAADARLFHLDALSDAHQRHPLPPEDEREAARKKLAAEFENAYGEAADPASKQQLAEFLVEQAGDITEDRARQFEMLQAAWRILINAGDLDRALSIVDRIDALFETDAVEMKAAVVSAAASSPSFKGKSAKLIDALVAVLNDATLAQNSEVEAQLLRLAKTFQKDAVASGRLEELEERIAFLEAEQRLKQEEALLLFGEDDPKDYMRVGRFALRQGHDWSKCLDLLSKGGDDPLARAAQEELSQPASSIAQVDLADQWYALSQTEEEGLRPYSSQRAHHWYSHALPNLSGFSKTKAETRIQSLNGEAGGPDTR